MGRTKTHMDICSLYDHMAHNTWTYGFVSFLYICVCVCVCVCVVVVVVVIDIERKAYLVLLQ